jgi:predicted HTH transcriptional regulator
MEVAMARLNEAALRRLIKGGETTTVEFKVATPRPVEMAERLCGMANAQGGVIIIGVEDMEHKVVGVPDERMAMTKDVILRATRQIIKPALVLNPPEPEIYQIDGKQLVVATVPPNNGSVYQSGGIFWVRRGTHTVPVESRKVVPTHLPASLTKSYPPNCERTPVVAKPPAKMEALIDRSARLAGSQTHPLTLPS